MWRHHLYWNRRTWVHHPNHNALVITAKVGNRNVHRILINNGSTMNILYVDTYHKIRLTDKDLKLACAALYDFTRDSSMPQGRIQLVVTIGDYPRTSTVMIDFLVLEGLLAYNALFGRPILKDLKAVMPIYHLGVKFPTSEWTWYMRGYQYEARECY